MPKISIVVPCWNVERFLDKCVESLVNQTFRDIEIILVDDLSPDRVPEMCDSWAKKDSRIKVVHKSKNEGLGMACNTGIEVATGEYIAFCDSDDWVDPSMYETLYHVAVHNSSDAVFSGLKRVDDSGMFISNIRHYETELLCNDREQINALILDLIAASPEKRPDRYIEPSAKVVLYRREIISRHNLRFQSERKVLSEDLFFNMYYLSYAGIVSVIPERFYNYRITPGSISKSTPECYFENQIVTLYNQLLETANSLNLNADVNERISRFIIGCTRLYVFRICNSDWTYLKKRKVICRISKDETWAAIWKHYPRSAMPIVHRVVVEAINHNFFAVLYLIAKIRRIHL